MTTFGSRIIQVEPEELPQMWVDLVKNAAHGMPFSRNSLRYMEDLARRITNEIVFSGQFPNEDQFEALFLLRAYHRRLVSEIASSRNPMI